MQLQFAVAYAFIFTRSHDSFSFHIRERNHKKYANKPAKKVSSIIVAKQIGEMKPLI
jgi:hypothetical protein